MNNNTNRDADFSLGMSREELELRRSLREGETLISDRLFHLIFGGVLLWGFLVNVLLVQNFTKPMVRLVYGSGAIGMILMVVVYFVCAIAGSRMLHAGGLMTSFIGFNLIAIPVGLLVSVAIYGYDTTLVLHALTLTLLATAIMTLMGALFPQFFLGLGQLLFIALGACLVGSLLCSLIFRSWAFAVEDWIVAGLMCLYIGYDWSRLSVCARTANNAVDMAAALYLDIVNLFLRILRILARSRSRN